MTLKEIFYCNLIVTHKNKKIIIKEVVYKDVNGYYDNIRELTKYGIKDKIKVDKIDVIHSMGFENPPLNKFSELKKADEKRNKITGAYE